MIEFPACDTEDAGKYDKRGMNNSRTNLMEGQDYQQHSEYVQDAVKVNLLNIPPVNWLLQHIRHHQLIQYRDHDIHILAAW